LTTDKTASAVSPQVSETIEEIVITEVEEAYLVTEKEKKEKTKKKREKKKTKRNNTLTSLVNCKDLHSVITKCVNAAYDNGLIVFCLALFLTGVTLLYELINIPAVSGSTIDMPLVKYQLVRYPDRELTLTIPGFSEISEASIFQNLSDGPPIRVDDSVNWLGKDINNDTLTVTITNIESHTGNYTIYDTTKSRKIVAIFYVHYLQNASIHITGEIYGNSSEEAFNTFQVTFVYDGPLVPAILDTYIYDLESVPSVPDDGHLMTKILKFKVPSHLDLRGKVLSMMFGPSPLGARFSLDYPAVNRSGINGTTIVEGKSYPNIVIAVIAVIVVIVALAYFCARSDTDAIRAVSEDPDSSVAMLS